MVDQPRVSSRHDRVRGRITRVTESLSQERAMRFYRRVLVIRLLWSVAIGAFLGGMLSLPLVLAGLGTLLATSVGLGVGFIFAGIAFTLSRVRRSRDADPTCTTQCSNCASAGSGGCLSGFDQELAGRIAAYDAERLGELGLRMRGVLLLPVLLMILDVVLVSRDIGIGPLVFALVAFIAAAIGLVMMGSRAVGHSS